MLAITAIVPALAQTPPAPTPTCTTAPGAPTALNIERTFTFSNALSTRTPTIDPQTQAAITAGALEARQLISLPTNSTAIQVTEFTATPGSTSPTLAQNITASSTLSSFTFNITNTLTSCKPVPTVLFVGTITNNFPKSPFGDVSGTPAALSIGYTTDAPPKINNVVLVYAGVAEVYSASGSGTITFPSGSVTPPGSANNSPVINFTPGATQTTAQKQIQLDASKSTSPINSALTYSWRQVNTNVSASISNASTATPLVTFAGRADYIFEVTVTDTQGNMSKAQTTITYVGNGS